MAEVSVKTYTVSGMIRFGEIQHEGDGHTTRTFREHTLRVEAEDHVAACKAFRERTQINPDYINMHEVDGICEGCERPIMQGEPYSYDVEGIMLCKGCDPEHAEEQPRVEFAKVV